MKDSINIGSKQDFYSLLYDILFNKEYHGHTKRLKMTHGAITYNYSFNRYGLGHYDGEEAYDLDIYEINPNIRLTIDPEKQSKSYGSYRRTNHLVYINWLNKFGGHMEISCSLNKQDE